MRRERLRMDDFAIAHIIHVVAVVFWIGGVGFVTLIIMPAIRASTTENDRPASFARIEGRFAWQARIWVALAGISGFWMVWRGQMWDRFSDPAFWWMHAMLLVWLIFAMILYVIEPLFLHPRLTQTDHPARLFRRMTMMHWVLLTLAVIALIGAVGGAHGLF